MMRRLWRAAGDFASASKSGRRLLVLTYHRVLARPDDLLIEDVDTAVFERQLAQLAEHFNVLRLDEALERLQADALPHRAVALTFDDGYADNFTVALPVLARYGLKAAFFIASGFLNGMRMWNDTIIEALRRARGPTVDLSALGLGRLDISSVAARRAAINRVITHLKHEAMDKRAELVGRLAELVAQPLPDGMMMTAAQVRALAEAGMLVGAHTVWHPVLAAVGREVAEREVAQGREQLAAIVGEPIEYFAYPNGRPARDYGRADVELVKRLGFRSALSTAWGFADRDSDRWQLPRVAPWDNIPWRLHLRLLRAYREPQTARV